MEPVRRAWLAPPLVVAVVAAVIGIVVGSRPGPTGAAEPTWDPPSCPSGATTDGAGPPVWFRLDERLSAAGTLVGRVLTLGVGESGTVRQLAVPPESFAAGPVDGIVLVGEDDGRASRLRALRPVEGCADEVATSRDVIRSAVIAPDGAILEHRLDRRTRSDLGVWRRDVDGGLPTRVIAPFAPDAGIGATFSTELVLGDDGSVAVVACGERTCRARAGRADGSGVPREVRDVGPLVGLEGDTLIAHAPCPGLPCAIEAVRLSDATRTVLADAAGLGAIVDGRVVHETAAGPRLALAAVDAVGGDATPLIDVPDGLRLLPPPARSGAGLEHPTGSVVLSADGRLGAAGPETVLVDLATGSFADPWEDLP